MKSIRVLALALLSGAAGIAYPAQSALAAEATNAAATIDYVVKKGDTCAAIAIAHYGDAKRVDLIHDANPGMGPSPHHLNEGTVLHLPPKPKTNADAKVSFVRNEVNAYTPESHAAHLEDPLMRGHRVDTQGNSSAEVTFADETRLQLGEHTLVVILGSNAGKATTTGTAADTTLMSGSLRAHLADLAGRGDASRSVGIATGSGSKVLIEGGDVLLSVDDAQTARLAVHRGKSVLRASGKEVSVAEGFGSKAEKNKPPTPPKPLPAIPVWSTLPSEIAFAPKGSVDVFAAYAAGQGAGPAPYEWHVQLGRDDRFNDLIVDKKVAKDIDKLEARALTAGTYFVRVSAIDDDEFEGKPSAVARVIVVEPTVVPAKTGQLGSIAVPPSLFCGIDDAPLVQHETPGKQAIDASRARPHVLRCAPSADGKNASTVPLPAERIGGLTVDVQMGDADPKAHTAHLAFLLRDATGAPVAGAKLTATASNDATVGPIAESATPGTYEAALRFADDTRSVVATVDVNGLENATSAPIAIPREPIVASPAAPRARSPYSGELAIMGGIGVTGDDLGVAPAVAAEVGVRRALAKWSLSLSLRARLERDTRTGAGACGPSRGPLAVPCLASTRAGYTYDFTDDALTLELPIAARLGAESARVLPYIAIAPGVLFDRAAVSTSTAPTYATSENAARFALHAFAGAQVRAGSGGFFLEAGYRISTVEHRATGDSHFSSFISVVGYRLSL